MFPGRAPPPLPLPGEGKSSGPARIQAGDREVRRGAPQTCGADSGLPSGKANPADGKTWQWPEGRGAGRVPGLKADKALVPVLGSRSRKLLSPLYRRGNRGEDRSNDLTWASMKQDN